MILRADARHVPLADESVDSIVTDPPYELGFMGKKWDRSGVAYSVDVWAEALRVLKPGGHLLAFGGSRTYHRLACAIEDAGFEIRDQIQWIYGSGFPKSLDVSKAIDKAAGAEREVVGIGARHGGGIPGNGTSYEVNPAIPSITAPSTDAARQWSGWGTALKPAHEPIVMARKPLGESTVAANVLAHGTGAINVDGCRVGLMTEGEIKRSGLSTGTPGYGGGHNPVSWKDGREPQGRWPANAITDGSEEVVRLFPAQAGAGGPASGPLHDGPRGPSNALNAMPGMNGRAAQFHGDTGSAARFFYCAKASKEDRDWGLSGGGRRIGEKGNGLARTCDVCGASTIDGCRCEGRTYSNPLRKNHHPTVKPTDLMRYLCRLVTPPGGIVLDPFAGSGSTLRGAFLEGFKPIGIELDAEYCRIARGRMNLLTPAMAGLMG